MKQRCAIDICDYFQGGECAGLCFQKVDTHRMQAPIRQVGGVIEQRERAARAPSVAAGGDDDTNDWLDLEWCWPAVAVVAVAICMLLGSVAALMIRGQL